MFSTKSLMIVISSIFLASVAQADVTHFRCKVKEEMDEIKTTVTVRFAIKDLDSYAGKGELIAYPGVSEEDAEENGLILVSPIENADGRYNMMTNLNGQGGDLRIMKNGNIRLFGDGAGYQFTDLVLWDSTDPDLAYAEGYVRDYGPAYGEYETFKQFIRCDRSNKKL